MTFEGDDRTRFAEVINGRRVGAFQVTLVAIVLVVLVIDGIDISLLSLVAPVIIQEWGVNRSDFGPALAAALVGMSLGAVLGGALGDRLGRLPVLIGSTLLFGAATAVAGLTDSVASMTAMRILSGLGFGAASPNAVALATDWLPERVRAQVTSLLSIGTPAGGMIGASLVILILPLTGWRGTFYACGALTLALGMAIFLFVRESPSYMVAKGRPDRAAALVKRHLGVDCGPLESGPVAANAAARPRETFLGKSNLRLNIGAGLGFFSVALVSYAFVAWTPILLTSESFSLNQALTAIFAFNLAAVGAALAAGFIMARLGSRVVLATSAGMLTGVVVLLGILLQSSPGAPSEETRLLVYLLVGSAGGFAGAATATIYSIMAVGYSVTCRAGGLGFGMMLGRAGGILASYLGGYLLDWGGGSIWLFLGALAVSSFLAAICAGISDRHVIPQRRTLRAA